MHFQSKIRSLLALALPVSLLASAGAQQPTFRSGVDLVRLDVTVVSDDGTPVRDLTPDDFAIEINGVSRPVRSLQFIDLARTAPDLGGSGSGAGDVTTNTASAGRLTVVVVDEETLIDGHDRPIIDTLTAFLGRMRPQDRTALISLPGRAARVDFTNDVEVLQAAAKKIRAWPPSVVAPEPIRIDRGEGGMLAGFETSNRHDYNPVTHTLTAIVKWLSTVDGPKSLVFVSRSLPGGTVNLSRYQEFAQQAAAARVSVYAVRVVTNVVDIYTATGINERPDTSLDGLNLIASASGGVVLNAIARGTGVFEQIERETTGSYVVGVDPPGEAAADKAMKIDVRVRKPGVQVRAPRHVVAPSRRTAPKDAKASVAASLRQPRVATDIPLRVGTFTARQASSDRLKGLMVAEVSGTGVDGGKLTWGYEIRDERRIVADGFDQKRDERAADGSSSVVLMSTASLPPGTYTLRLAVTDAEGRRGSIERPLSVRLHDAGGASCSDLFVGSAVDGRFQPHVSFPGSADRIVAFIELYLDDSAGEAAVEFTLRGADDVVHSSGRIAAPPSGGAKRIVQASLPVGGLPPGTYHLSAQPILGGRPVAVVRRSFLLGT